MSQPESPPEAANVFHCRHCGAQLQNPAVAEHTDDWLCPTCKRYQDATTCPTCGNLTRISTLPAEMQPPVHEPNTPAPEPVSETKEEG